VWIFCHTLGMHQRSECACRHKDINFYVLLTVHFSIILDNDQLDAHLLYFILQYVYYNPVHDSSIICSSSVRWILLMQHLVSSLSVSSRPVHRFSLNLCTGRPLAESDDTRYCINKIQPPDDEHIMLETGRRF